MNRSEVNTELRRDELRRDDLLSSPPLTSPHAGRLLKPIVARRLQFRLANFYNLLAAQHRQGVPQKGATTMDQHPLRSVFMRRPEAMGSINGGSMQVFSDPSRNQVILRSEGSEIRLSWAAALNLGSLLIKKAEEAEPPARPGKTYEPTPER